jgi:hypothetical protein
MYACNLPLISRNIETETEGMCGYVNYHIVMLCVCWVLSACLACGTLILKAYYGRNPTPQQEDLMETGGRWALTTLALAFGFEGALILFYVICFVAVCGMLAYLCLLELHHTAMHTARLLFRRSNVVASHSAQASALDTCPICLETDNGPWLTTQCGHVFHIACIRKWRQDTCPMCRGSV